MSIPTRCQGDDKVPDATSSVNIGGVEVPANCALARKVHPRLLFTTADLPRLCARLKNPQIAAEMEHAKQLAAEKKAGAILLGVLYYLTEQREYIDQAKTKLQPSWEQTYPLAADLVMGAMTPAEQQAEADRIVEVIKKERWRPHLVLDLAAWGHGHDEFLAADLKTRYRSDMVEGISKISMGWGTSAMGQGAVWGKLLWYDPKLPPVEPKMLPPARLFPENGHVVMRSDWTPGATYALFRCGRYGEIDGLWGRNNADNLHFIINKRGILAADTGAVHSLNNAALGFAGSQVHSDGLPHIQEFHRCAGSERLSAVTPGSRRFHGDTGVNERET